VGDHGLCFLPFVLLHISRVSVMLELLGVALLVIGATVLAWLSFRAWQTKILLIKWGGAGLAALLSLTVLLISVVAIAGLYKLYSRSAAAPELKIASTPDQIRRGKAIADSFCSGCHSRTGTLTGGLDIGQHFPVPIGSFITANLTPAGPLSHWSDGEIFNAVRNSVDRDGRWLMIMSYTNAGKLSDDDIRAVIAYMRSLPAAGEPTAGPLDHLNLLGIAMLGAGMLPASVPVSSGVIKAPPVGPTLDYGEYILSYQDCRNCHGARLTGGVPGQIAPLGPDLNLVKAWKFEEFVATMRTGTDPNGHQIGKEMPWRPIGRMSDEELGAVYEYLTHLPDR
jgi:mono/diheme cytochrome c family protein